MLESLFGSKTRVSILANLLLHPEQEVHLRDLSDQIGAAPRGVQVEVDRLVNLGVLLERRSRTRRYLSANIGHRLYGPLRQLLEQSVGVVPALEEALSSSPLVELAVVYGSFARREAGPSSDLDLLIVGEISLGEVLEITSPLQERFDLDITPVVMTESEFRARRARKEHFISSLLASPTIPLVGDLDVTG